MTKNAPSSTPKRGASGRGRCAPPPAYASANYASPTISPDERDAIEAAKAAALDWIARGCPESEIVYDDDAPRTTAADWADAETVEVRFTRRKTGSR
ncbi:MAG: hypothetical protein HQL40_00420 [Alphaproteobacteria bacterium]|nr:hypothetical protein [Alphaproteobacteria bacterium]